MKALHFAIGYRTTGTQKAAAGEHIRYITRAPAEAGEHAAYVIRTKGYVREDLIATGVGNLPEWAEGNPIRFFEAADQHERGGAIRAGRTATQITASLPRDLTHSQQREAIDGFVQGQLGTRHAYVWGLHETVASDGKRYPHVHLAFSERADTGEGLAPLDYFSQRGYQKDRTFHDRSWPRAARQAWADTLNITLEQAGVAMRVDARTFRDQGLDMQGSRYVSRLDVKDDPEVLRQRTVVPDTPEMQASRAAAWEARKQALGLTVGMSRDEIVQRIGDASREAIAAHQAQRQQVAVALSSDATAVTRQLESIQEKQEKARDVIRDEVHYTQHPEQPRSLQHLAAAARLLQSTEEDTPQRRMRRQLGHGDEDEQGQRRGYGLSR